MNNYISHHKTKKNNSLILKPNNYNNCQNNNKISKNLNKPLINKQTKLIKKPAN
jgi:hypothetical protein